MTTYGVTGASGQLGRLVLDELVRMVGPGAITAFGRDVSKLADFAESGVTVRPMDYDDPATLPAALSGIDRLLLISGSALGQRPRQHGNVIDAARQAGVGYIAYTSILEAPTTPIRLGAEHAATERALADSGIAHDLLRNGWYNENYMAALPAQLDAGVITGAQGRGRISSAARSDLAAGAAHVLVEGPGGRTYNLAGDESWTMEDFAAELSRQSGKFVRYVDMGEEEYAASLRALGMPEAYSVVVANSARSTSLGALQNDSQTLSGLIGRPTTPIGQTMARALAAL